MIRLLFVFKYHFYIVNYRLICVSINSWFSSNYHVSTFHQIYSVSSNCHVLISKFIPFNLTVKCQSPSLFHLI